jgi:hypothetical protein
MAELKPFSWVQERIIELAELYPERKANSQYFDEGKRPDCIVGHVLHDLGAQPSSGDGGRIFNADKSRWMVASSVVDRIDWTKFGVEKPSPAQAMWIHKVQQKQDYEYCWADAVAG